jgi:hypothetical protein
MWAMVAREILPSISSLLINLWCLLALQTLKSSKAFYRLTIAL